MSKINVRIRSASKGVQNLQGIEDSLPLNEFKTLLESQTGIPSNKQKVMFGYPPKALPGFSTESISSLGLTSGETLTIEELAQPLADVQGPSAQTPSNPVQVPTRPSPTDSPAIVSNESDTLFLRRVVDADNSCLFNSVAYVLENRNKTKSNELRNIIAQFVLGKPQEYSEAVLGKTPQDYAKWIQHKDSWGGAIELSILSEYYSTEICAFDTQTVRMDTYGEGKQYKQRAFLIYDGLHYDPLALSFGKDLPQDLDVTLFSPLDSSAVTKARVVAKESHDTRQFTDMANFDIRCLVCNVGLKGEKGILEHTKKTAHTNFAEYK